MNNSANKSAATFSSTGGFLLFNGGKPSSSSSSSAHVSSKGNSTTIHFTAPKVIGYYVEAAPANIITASDDALRFGGSEYVTIIDFVNKCKELLFQHRKEMLNE